LNCPVCSLHQVMKVNKMQWDQPCQPIMIHSLILPVLGLIFKSIQDAINHGLWSLGMMMICFVSRNHHREKVIVETGPVDFIWTDS
jgi:hypothetical protein